MTDGSAMVDPQLRLDQDYYASPGPSAPPVPGGAWQAVPVPAPGRRYVLLAVLLALLPGVVFLFGGGHFYAGRWRAGIAYFVGYWMVMVPLLVYAPSGSYALAWLAMLVWTPISAARAVHQRNVRLGLR
ncbi:MAG: hypothetical protein QOH97_3960 [Actinoplanes sp.]|jgi:hypothetical protein|nr:hypothetical protein [Actinoplanes sp.]